MAYFKHRRTQDPYQQTFRQPVPQAGQEDDVVYTEEDYAADPNDPQWQDEWAAQNEAFLPDDAEYPADVAYEDAYEDFTDTGDFADTDDFSDLLDGDPLADDLLTDEEREELHQSRWRLIAVLGDFAGVIVGVGVILLMVMLLISLMNWLAADIVQTFTLWQANM